MTKPIHFKENDSCHNCEYRDYIRNSSMDNNYFCGLHDFVISDGEIDRNKCEDWNREECK